MSKKVKTFDSYGFTLLGSSTKKEKIFVKHSNRDTEMLFVDCLKNSYQVTYFKNYRESIPDTNLVASLLEYLEQN